MAITCTLNTTFQHLNDDRSLKSRANTSSRERTAIVDIAFGASDDYVNPGGVTVDFSKVRGFTKVYACDIIQSDIGRVMTYVPASGNAAATGKIKIFHTDGTELSNGNTLTRSKSIRVQIRGI